MSGTGEVLEYRTSDLQDPLAVAEICLDSRLLTSWSRLMAAGSFRYSLDTRRDRVLEGGLGLLAQYNPCRAKLRRQPQAMMALTQRPDPAAFNFTKIDESRELLFELRNLDRQQQSKVRHLLIINVSPIDPGHSLLVPSCQERLPQQLTLEAVTAGLELAALSSHPGVRVAFNSLCAHASVNHLHWHCYFIQHRVRLQEVQLARVAGPCWTWAREHYPAQGWCFLLPRRPSPTSLDSTAAAVVLLTEWLTARETAHNVMVCLGAGQEGGPGVDWVRVLVWARESVLGAKEPGDFVMAVCELSGQVLVYEEEGYERLQEEEVVTVMEAATRRVYTGLEGDVEQLFADNCVQNGI